MRKSNHPVALKIKNLLSGMIDGIMSILRMEKKWAFIGHTAFSYSVKFVSPTVIAAFPLGEPIIASYLAWLLFAERVSFYVVGGGLIIFIGLIILIKKQSE